MQFRNISCSTSPSSVKKYQHVSVTHN